MTSSAESRHGLLTIPTCVLDYLMEEGGPLTLCISECI